MSERIAESELIINPDGTVFHLHLHPEELADTVILVGDPGRVRMVASYFDKDSIEFERESRELHTITGRYHGKRVTVLSTGMGTDNIDIVMTELDALANIDFETRLPRKEHRTLTILRIGTSGAIRPEIPLGSYVFSRMSVGFDGVLNWYADGEKVRENDIEQAFVKYMDWPERFAIPYFVKSSDKIAERFKGFTISGVTMSAPGFYGPQGRSVRMKLTVPDLVYRMEGFSFGEWKITNIEMESSALAGMAAVLGHEAGTVCLIIANRYAKESNPDYKALMAEMVQKSLDALTRD